MNTWKTWIQMNGEDITHYVQKDIEISDELYSQIKSAVEEGNKLSQCDFADELLWWQKFHPELNVLNKQN